MYIYKHTNAAHLEEVGMVWFLQDCCCSCLCKKLQGHNNNNNVKKNGHVVNQTIDLTGWPQMSIPVIHKPMFQLIQD